MGLFGDLAKGVFNSLKEQSEKMNSLYEDWDDRDVSFDFLITKLKRGNLSEKAAARKLLINKYDMSNDDINFYMKY